MSASPFSPQPEWIVIGDVRSCLPEPPPVYLPASLKAISYVYFVEAPELGRVKIGITSEPKRRFAALRSGSPTPLRLVGYFRADQAAESRLHEHLELDRRNGEWFVDSEFIRDIAAGLVTTWVDGFSGDGEH